MKLAISFVFGLVCLSAVFADFTPEQLARLKEMKETCIAETGVSEEVLKNPTGEEAMTDEKLPCFGACLLRALGMLGPDGNLDADAAIQKLPEGVPKDEATEIIKTCSKEKGANDCETAKLAFQCFHEHNGHEVIRMFSH